ncbi:MAG: hypothetical protein Tsb0034_05080 [Ekhidna sp.]
MQYSKSAIEKIKVKRVKVNSIPHYTKKLPLLTTNQMIEVDRLMIEEYGILLIQMMENAGRGLAHLSKKLLKGKKNLDIIVLAGKGGNGGGALVCARRLHTWGYNVKVYSVDSQNISSIPGHQLGILKKMGIEILNDSELQHEDNVGLIIDGIIGYNLKDNPQGTAKSMINWANKQEVVVLSLDTPSGVDLSTGKIYEPAICADATLTLALPKVGLFNDEVVPMRGDLYLGDISVPPSLYASSTLGLKVKNIFKKSDILRID